jgi:hypothetical protein
MSAGAVAVVLVAVVVVQGAVVVMVVKDRRAAEGWDMERANAWQCGHARPEVCDGGVECLSREDERVRGRCGGWQHVRDGAGDVRQGVRERDSALPRAEEAEVRLGGEGEGQRGGAVAEQELGEQVAHNVLWQASDEQSREGRREVHWDGKNMRCRTAESPPRPRKKGSSKSQKDGRRVWR